MVVPKTEQSADTIKRVEQHIASVVQKRAEMTRKNPVKVDTPYGEGYRVTISSDSVDRVGDIVVQNFTNLASIKERGLTACFGHDTSRPIGRYIDLKTYKEGRVTKTDATLIPLPKGVSADADLVRALLEFGWIDNSIGFRPHKITPIKGGDGLILDENELHECSPTPTPANTDAVARLEGKHLLEQFTKACDPSTGRCHIPAKRQLEEIDGETVIPQKSSSDSTQPAVRDSAISGHQKSHTNRYKPMTTLSEKIVAAEDSLVTKRDALTAIFDTDVDENGDLTEDGALKADELTNQIEKAEADVARLKKAESALKFQAKAAENGRNPHIEMRKLRKKGHVFFGAITAKVKAHGERLHPVQVAAAHYKDDPEVGIILKAESEPADMTSASAIVQEYTAEFFDLLRDQSVYQQIPGVRLQFDRYGSISVPYDSAARGALAGGFVGEGSAIPVKAGGFSEKTLAPKKAGTISTFSKELAMHSTPSIQGMIQARILADTAEALDAAFFDANARTATRPAGMQDPTDGAGAANIVGSLGPTVANITSDLKGVMSRAMAARVGNSGVWVMNPLRRLGLMTVQDAASGEYPFRDEVNRGTLFGFPIIISQNVDPALVSFIPSDTIVFANDYAPRIDVSDSATLHMEDSAALPLNDGTTAAAPVRSLYQTDTMAVRMTLGLDWLIVRPDGCQVLTGVAW